MTDHQATDGDPAGSTVTQLSSAAAQPDPAFREEALKLMSAGLMVGEAMLRSQVATSDVESAVRRLNSAFGVAQIEVSVTMNQILLGLMDPRLEFPMSTMRVVEIGSVRLDLLVSFEDVLRRVEQGELGIDDTITELERVANAPGARPAWVNSLFYLAAVAAWVVFAGGGPIGALSGVVAAVVVQVVVVPLSRARLPDVFGTALAALMAVAAPAAAAYLGVPIAMTPAIVGGLYPLLPGAMLVASVTDGLSGTPISSMAKGLQASVTAVAVALGALGALLVVNDLGIKDTAVAPQIPEIVIGLTAAVAVVAIGLSRSIPLRLAPGTGLLAFAAWALHLAVPETSDGFPTASFAAAVLIGAGGQVIARIRHTSSSVYTTTAVFVLVPGFTTYLAMVSFAQGKSDVGMELLIRALSISLAIAAGVTLGVALTRRMPLPRARLRPWGRRSQTGPPVASERTESS